MRTRVIVATVLMMWSSQVGLAQIQTLSFQEAVKIALKNNVALQQEENLLLVQQSQKNQSVAAFLPSVGLRGTAQHSDGQQPNPDGGDLQDLSIDNLSADLSASLTLFDGFGRMNRLSQNVNAFKAQSSFVRRTEQDVVYQVTNQYLQVLLDQELLRIAHENYTAQNTVLEQLQEQVRLGLRPEVDLYSQQAQVRNMESIALRAEVTLANDKSLLGQIIQLDLTADFAVDFPDLENESSWARLPLDSLYAIGFANREDLKQFEFETASYHSAFAASSAGYYPDISLFAVYGSSYNSALSDRAAYDGFQNQFTRVFPSFSYGVSVQIPLFDRLVTRNSRVSSRVAYDNAILRQQNLQKTIRIDIQRAFNNYQAAVKAYEAGQLQFKAGELALETQEEGYRLGASDQVALAQANQLYVQAAATKAQTEVTLLFQNIMLSYALGTLRVEDYVTSQN